MNHPFPGGRSSVRAVIALLAFTFALVACDRPQRTADDLRAQVTAYQTNPTDEAQAKIDAGLTRLDAQIDKLAADGKTAEATRLRATEANLRSDYRSARMVRSIKNAQSAIQGLGETLHEAGQSIEDAFKPTPTPP